MPRQVFARRADRIAAAPDGASYRRSWLALNPPGSVLDVGTGGGAACLPLLPRCTALTAVDADEPMLALLAQRTAAPGAGVSGTGAAGAGAAGAGAAGAGALRGGVRLVTGQWPQVAPQAGSADLVTCYNVVYNVPDIGPFLTALTASARRTVVLELTEEHPLVSLNALWLRFHGLRRPQGPVADDLLQILGAMGIQAGYERWQRPGGADYASLAELAQITTRRLCLPPERAGEVAEALAEEGIDSDQPVDLGTSRRDVVTIWWHGTAGPQDAVTG